MATRSTIKHQQKRRTLTRANWPCIGTDWAARAVKIKTVYEYSRKRNRDGGNIWAHFQTAFITTGLRGGFVRSVDCFISWLIETKWRLILLNDRFKITSSGIWLGSLKQYFFYRLNRYVIFITKFDLFLLVHMFFVFMTFFYFFLNILAVIFIIWFFNILVSCVALVLHHVAVLSGLSVRNVQTWLVTRSGLAWWSFCRAIFFKPVVKSNRCKHILLLKKK